MPLDRAEDPNHDRLIDEMSTDVEIQVGVLQLLDDQGLDAAVLGFLDGGGGYADATCSAAERQAARHRRTTGGLGEEFPPECPACGGDIRLITFITKRGPSARSSRT